jgi:hypothetical protein
MALGVIYREARNGDRLATTRIPLVLEVEKQAS